MGAADGTRARPARALALVVVAVAGCSGGPGGGPGGSARDHGAPTEPPAPTAPFPNAGNTGVPAGTRFVKTVNGDYVADMPGQAIDQWHITGTLIVAADGVAITRSEIDGVVGNGYSGDYAARFTIADSTVGPPSGCNDGNSAVGQANYSATRVHLRHTSDGFGATRETVTRGTNVAGRSDVVIRDSFVELCAIGDSHSDGLQAFRGGSNVRLLHSTIDELPCSRAAAFPAAWACTPDFAQTAPVFISDDSPEADVEDNLFIGGSSSIRVGDGSSPVASGVVRGNRVVDQSWIFSPVDSHPCARLDWSDNQVVRVDADFQVTAVVGPLACAP